MGLIGFGSPNDVKNFQLIFVVNFSFLKYVNLVNVFCQKKKKIGLYCLNEKKRTISPL